ncbi:MAG: hypothetical protein P4L79_09820 [Legionella sp.]|uniref:hypothetical protein n=1 Tax=Legionella sp. TaxID=459 RepID=UPI00284E8A38|nr:hypothetical protein [Legionella sp.]
MNKLIYVINNCVSSSDRIALEKRRVKDLKHLEDKLDILTKEIASLKIQINKIKGE